MTPTDISNLEALAGIRAGLRTLRDTTSRTMDLEARVTFSTGLKKGLIEVLNALGECEELAEDAEYEIKHEKSFGALTTSRKL